MLETVAATMPLRDELAALIAASESLSDVEKALQGFTQRHQGSDAIALPLFRAGCLSDLAGQLFVRTIEVPEAGRKLANEATPQFLRLPFREAVEWFVDRYSKNPEDVYRILDGYRRRADEAARIYVEQLAERARKELQRALEEGSSLDAFARALADEAVTIGVEPAKPHYVENVFRTQVQSAYGAGRFRQMTDPDVIEQRPYVEYRTVGDNRVRASHAELDGKQWKITDPDWKRFAPPNGFQCRCSTVTLDADEVDQSALRRDITTSPDKGFEGPPTDAIDSSLT